MESLPELKLDDFKDNYEYIKIYEKEKKKKRKKKKKEVLSKMI